jgi:hypothetical protein
MYVNRRYNDGAVIGSRAVFYNGKRWTDHRIPANTTHDVFYGIYRPSPERHFTSVYPSITARYPRAVH